MKVVGIYIQDSETLEYNRVDLFDDEKISVTSSIQNINDISKTYTDFSQTFSVPATKQNNKIFKHWYENSNDAPFSTLSKSNSYIEIDTILFRKGKIQLESANLINGQPQDYSITFIGILGNLKDTFAGKFLKDLTLDTSYDFNYNATLVKDKVTTTTVSSDIMFPLISSLNNWALYPVRYNELYPALKLRAVLNMIENQFGINFDGAFLSDARFTNAYLYLKNAEIFEFKPTSSIITFQNISAITTYGTNPTNCFLNPPLVNNEIYTVLTRPTSTFASGVLTITPTVANIIYTINFRKKDGYLIYTSKQTSIVGNQTFNLTMNYYDNSYYLEIIPEQNLTFNASILLTSRNAPPGVSMSFVYQTLSKSSNQTVTIPNLSIKDYMPEIKIEDFFSGLLKMFNLTCFSSDGINYTVEQLENYYSDGSDIDITKYILQDKKALNRVKTYKKINFDYEKSESLINVAFNSNAGIEYGSLRYENNPKTEGEEYSIKLPFENLNFTNVGGLLQVGYTLKTDFQSYIPKPIILYDYNPSALTTVPTWYFSTALTGAGDPYTKYKAFGQETLISGETYGLNFNQQQSTLTNEIVNNGLYQNYYSNYFNNIYNLKARLIKVSAILPTSIITTLKLNDNVIIRDTKYLINTFTTDLTTGEVQFELLTDQRL